MQRQTNRLQPLSAAVILGGLAALSGCTASRTFVLESAPMQRGHMVASLSRLPSTVDVSPSLATRFEEELSRRLGPEAQVAPAPAGDLIIGYRFVLFDVGSSAARVGAGVASLAGSPFYGVGDGALGIDITFTSSDGRTLGRILVDGPISGPFGSAESGLAAAAGSVAKYTKASFLPSEPARTGASGTTEHLAGADARETASR